MAIAISERVNDPVEMLLSAIEGVLRGTWTALPGIVQEFDAEKLTCTVRPAIQQLWALKDGTTQFKTMTLLQDVPVVFPRAGGFILTFPLQQGDEVLVVFAARCIDAWHQQGGVQPQVELRMHDLSDGFAIPGVGSLAKPISGGANTTTCQLRSIDSKVVIELTPDHQINIVAPGDVTINALPGDTTIHGNLTVYGVISTVNGGDMVSSGNVRVTGIVEAGVGTGDQVNLQTHRHSGGPPPDPGS